MDKFYSLIRDIVTLLEKYGPTYLKGIGNTLLLAVIATALGCLIGLICGILQTIPRTKKDNVLKRFFLSLIRVIIRVYIEVFRGTPMILQAVFIFYGVPYFTNNAVRFENIWSVAIIVVSINTGAYMAESVRGGILSIDPGQTEAAKAIGMTHFQTMTSIILPQAIRNIMPQIGNNFIINVKDTSVMFVIGFTEFFAAHQGIVGASYKFFPSAVIEMVGYLCMTLLSSFLLRWVEKKMDGSSSYELTATDQLVMTSGNYALRKSDPFTERSKEFSENMHASRKNRKRSTKGER